MDSKWGARAGAAAFALGLSIAGPQALGLALADSEDGNSAAASAADQAVSSPSRATKAGASRASRSAAGPRSAAATSAGPRSAAATSVRSRTVLRPVPGAAPVSPIGEVAAAEVNTAADADALVSAKAPAAAPRAAFAPAPRARALAASAVAAPTLGSTGFVRAADDWLSGLTVNPFSDFVTGAMRLTRRTSLTAANAVAAETVSLTSLDPNQHVLLIGVDGTDLSKILEDPYNQAFFGLMDDGTTAAATMVGHTTVSDPGWTGILTGVWSETAGVSNNVFTPWTYDTWPTVFNQLEAADSSISTTVIGDWSVIAQIAGAGSKPADTIVYYPQINGSWQETDDAVGNRSIQAIQNTVAGTPSLQMTYFVGVDDTGHDTYGAGSPEYAAALRNVNDNIADIMSAVDSWETANPGETWTVITVTDHGQVLKAPLSPIVAGLLAHGFQSPIETTPFVIAVGPDFAGGAINNTYSQMDVTPTILSLFGLAQQPYFAGKPLMDKVASDYRPVVPGQLALKNALNDALGMYGYPDIATNLSLTLRTLAATVPYAVYTLFSGLADPGDCSSFTCILFEANSLPELVAVPVLFVGAVIYNIVNIPVQVIVRLTGVTGNQIIPRNWWPFLPVPGTQPVPPTAAVPPAMVEV